MSADELVGAAPAEGGRLMIACQSFATGDRLFREGDVVAGDDPLLSTHPQLFVPAGTPRSDWPKPQTPPPREQTRPSRQRDRKPDDVIAKSNLSGLLGNGTSVRITRGHRYPATHALVRRYPEWFRPVDETDESRKRERS